MCTTAAPASYARRASSPISAGVYGRYGHCSRVASTPVSAAVTMTRSCTRPMLAVLPRGRPPLQEGRDALRGVLRTEVERELPGEEIHRLGQRHVVRPGEGGLAQREDGPALPRHPRGQ